MFSELIAMKTTLALQTLIIIDQMLLFMATKSLTKAPDVALFK